jgi:hypothetical protein
MTREKKGSDSRRVIMDLSFPEGTSVNDGIPKNMYLGEQTELTYAKVDDLVDMVLSHQKPLVWKIDLKRAFRQIPVDPRDYPMLGIAWDQQLYFDTSIPFGVRTGSYCCQRMTNAITYMMKRRNHDIINYVDDLAGCGEPDEAWSGFHHMQDLIARLGLTAAEDKTCEPSDYMVFLGILFNLQDQLLQIPRDRLEDIMCLLRDWQGRSRATKRQIQTILGKLHFIAQCVKPARLFVGRMLEMLRACPQHGYIELSYDFKKDINWFSAFLPLYNGISLMRHLDLESRDQELYADSCLTGCGAVYNGEYYHAEFPEFVQEVNHNIARLEFLNLVIASKLWGAQWKGLRISFRCDNAACCSVLNTGKGRDGYMLQCAREIWYLSARYDFVVTARHVPGIDNIVSDSLSRWHLGKNYRETFHQQTQGRHLREIDVDPYMFKLTATL